jgi:hypothetical protein
MKEEARVKAMEAIMKKLQQQRWVAFVTALAVVISFGLTASTWA